MGLLVCLLMRRRRVRVRDLGWIRSLGSGWIKRPAPLRLGLVGSCLIYLGGWGYSVFMAKKVLKSGGDGILCVYVIYGKDRRLALEELQSVSDRVLGEADPQVCLSRYEGAVEWADVLDDLCTLPFLSERRLVVIKDADAFITAYRENLEKYLESPSETGVLVLMPDSFPKTTRLAKKVAKLGGLVNCEPVKPRDLPNYLVGYAKERHGLQLLRDGVEALVELVGEGANLLTNEIDKLATFLGSGEDAKKRIDLEVIHKLTGSNRQFNVFNVIDAMTVGKTSLALSRLDQMLSQNREAQYTVVGAFAWHIRRLYNARLMMNRGLGGQAIIKQLRIWSQGDRFIGQVKGLSLGKIAGILQGLTDLDYAVKTSARSVNDGLEKLIIEFG
jgi:DNA polymerase-3 subunit delta